MAPIIESSLPLKSSPTDPEKLLEPPLPHLTPVYSSGSTIGDALDAEANLPPAGAAPSTDAEKSDELGPPPDGGWQAWLQVLGSFFLFFNSWYVLNGPQWQIDSIILTFQSHLTTSD